MVVLTLADWAQGLVSQRFMAGMKFSDDSMALMTAVQAHSANGIRLQEKDETQANSDDDR